MHSRQDEKSGHGESFVNFIYPEKLHLQTVRGSCACLIFSIGAATYCNREQAVEFYSKVLDRNHLDVAVAANLKVEPFIAAIRALEINDNNTKFWKLI